MKKLIHRYLSATLYIEKYTIKWLSNHSFVSSDILVKDLNKIFYLNKKEIKWWVKSWVKKQNRNFNFNEWWTPLSKYSIWMPGMPIGTRPMMATLRSVISVEPMSRPSSRLFYMDNYQYTPIIEQYTASIDPIDSVTPRLSLTNRYGMAIISEEI